MLLLNNMIQVKGYIPELDGLRAIAVMSVITFHIMPLTLPGGFLGVDVFFVLSGYLITSLLLREYCLQGVISLSHFYWRRALRLAPALLFLLLSFLVASACFPDVFGSFYQRLKEALIAGVYLTNWARAFGLYPADPFLAHTWSLAIEEQFYLLWPFFLIVLLKVPYKSTRLIACAAVLLIIAVCGWRIFLLNNGATIDRIYNGLDTRADALMWGALIAVAPLKRWLGGRAAHVLFAIAITLLSCLLMVSSWESASHYVWKLPFIYLLIATLIALSAQQHIAGCRRLLGSGFMVFSGKISYGLYLWHMPVLVVMIKQGVSGFALFASVMFVSYAVAAFSWFFIERPALVFKSRFKKV